MKYHQFKPIILLFVLVLGTFSSYALLAQSSPWNCWETSYKYKYTVTHKIEDPNYEDTIIITQEAMSNLLVVEVADNVITFRSPYIHNVFMGLQKFNTSEEYNDYLSQVWNYDFTANTSRVKLLYLPSEKKVCLADNLDRLIYSNFSLPIDMVELMTQMLNSGLVINGWLLPVNSPDFDVLTDYSSYNIEDSNDGSSHTKNYAGSFEKTFWFKGRYLSGYKLLLTITEERKENGVLVFESRKDITLCYSKTGVLYSYSLIMSSANYTAELSFDTNMKVTLEEPHKGLGGMPLYLIILLTVIFAGVTSGVILIIMRKRRSHNTT